MGSLSLQGTQGSAWQESWAPIWEGGGRGSLAAGASPGAGYCVPQGSLAGWMGVLLTGRPRGHPAAAAVRSLSAEASASGHTNSVPDICHSCVSHGGNTIGGCKKAGRFGLGRHRPPPIS